jgi:hypothetical protein
VTVTLPKENGVAQEFGMPIPETVTPMPPRIGPEAGETLVMIG